MKTGPIYIITIFLLSLNTIIYAQQDQQAGKILDQLFEKMKSAPSVSMDFTIAISSARDNFSDEFDGSMIMKGERYRLNFMGNEIFFDGKTIYSYMPEANEAMISEPDEDEGILANPTKLFTDYSKEFRYRFIGETSRNGKRLYEIDLHPLELDQMFHTIKLFIDREKNFLDSAVISAKDGNTYTFSVDKADMSKQVPDSHFNFRKEDYPGVEIIDMRW
jgi:outer membrane lipoprotein-sorting protein